MKNVGHRTKIYAGLWSLTFGLYSAPIAAAVPSSLGFEGHLVDGATDEPVTDTLDMEFVILDDTSNEPCYQATNTVEVVNGTFATILENIESCSFNNPHSVRLSVEGEQQ